MASWEEKTWSDVEVNLAGCKMVESSDVESLCSGLKSAIVTVSDDSVCEQGPGKGKEVVAHSEVSSEVSFDDSWICAICHETIEVEETAQIKGCEHAYCATCILQWAACKTVPWCPQCRTPFSSLYLYKTLDGSLSDIMVEECVCLLLRASWFKPQNSPAVANAEHYDEDEDCYYEEEYYHAPLRIGNRRWGENGYVRNGRLEARKPVAATVPKNCGASTSMGKAPAERKQGTGRRAKRSQRRGLADGV